MNKIMQNRLSLGAIILVVSSVTSTPATAMRVAQRPAHYPYQQQAYQQQQQQAYQRAQQAYQQQQQAYQWQQAYQQQAYLQQQAQQRQQLRPYQGAVQQNQRAPQNAAQQNQRVNRQAIHPAANQEIANQEETNMAIAIQASLRDEQDRQKRENERIHQETKRKFENEQRIIFLNHKIASAHQEIASYEIIAQLIENQGAANGEESEIINTSIASLRESIAQDTKELSEIQPAAQPAQPKINPTVSAPASKKPAATRQAAPVQSRKMPAPAKSVARPTTAQAPKIPAVPPQADRSRVVEPNNVRPNRAPLHINKIQLYSSQQSDATCGAWAAANAEIALNYCNNPTHIPNDLQNRFLYHRGEKANFLRTVVANIRNYRASLKNNMGQYMMATQDRTSPSHLNGQWLDGFEIQDLINRQMLAVNPNQISVWENSDQLLKSPHDDAWIETPRIQFGIPHAFIVGNMRQNGDRGIGHGHWFTVVWDGQGNLIIVDSLNGNQQNSPIVDNVVRYVIEQLSIQ